MEYEVVTPIGERSPAQQIPLAPRSSTLDGKTVCELSASVFREAEMFPLIRESLHKRYRNLKIVPYTEFPMQMAFTSSEEIDERVRATLELVKQKGCDAVISGVGG